MLLYQVLRSPYQPAARQLRLRLAALLAILLTACSGPTGNPPQAAAEPGKPTTIWEFVDQSVAALPLTPETVSNLFGVVLHHDFPQAGNDGDTWSGDAIELSPELRLTLTYISIAKASAWRYTAFEFHAKKCVTAQEIKDRYPAVERLPGAPGVYPDDSSSLWAVNQPWGKLRLTISTSTHCLEGVSFEPKDNS